MKLNRQPVREGKPGRPRPLLAAEAIQPPKETEFKFDPSKHLTSKDWQKAKTEYRHFQADNNPVGAFGLLFFEKIIDQERSEQEWNNTESTAVREWLQDLGTSKAVATMTTVLKERIVLKIKTIIFARNLFPLQPEFKVSGESLNQFISSAYGSAAPLPAPKSAALHALETAYFKKQCPDQSTEQIPPSLDLTPEHINEIISGIESNMDQLDSELWKKIILQIVMLRVTSPESFSKLNLDQSFWDKAVGMLEKMRREVLPTYAFFQYASHLKILAANEVNLDPKGNLHLSKKGAGLRKATPLPERDMN